MNEFKGSIIDELYERIKELEKQLKFTEEALLKETGSSICFGCWNLIDPEVCHCGNYIKDHGWYDGHNGVPMGCTCGYVNQSKKMRETC